jgi:hypothetical protein
MSVPASGDRQRRPYGPALSRRELRARLGALGMPAAGTGVSVGQHD